MKVPRITLGSKPCLMFEGAEFESDPDMKRVGNLLVDFFRGPVVDHVGFNNIKIIVISLISEIVLQVRLQGLEYVISFTCKDKNIYMRVYRFL